MVFQWLRLHTPNAGAPGSIPGGGNTARWTKSSQAATKILRAVTRRQKILCAATKTQLSQTNKFLRRQLLTSIPNNLSVKSKAPFMKVKVVQSCPTLCNPTDYTVHGILQARILEWVSYPFSRGSSWPRDQTGVSCIVDRFSTSWATREALYPTLNLNSFSFLLRNFL